jgi:hypothetical protein
LEETVLLYPGYLYLNSKSMILPEAAHVSFLELKPGELAVYPQLG